MSKECMTGRALLLPPKSPVCLTRSRRTGLRMSKESLNSKKLSKIMQVFEFVCIFSHFYSFILLKQSFCSLPEPSYSLASLVIYAFLSRSYLKRKGIVINETEVVLYGQLLTGRKYVPKANGVVELEKQWAKQVLPFAYQAVVKVPAHKHDSEKKTENNG